MHSNTSCGTMVVKIYINESVYIKSWEVDIMKLAEGIMGAICGNWGEGKLKM